LWEIDLVIRRTLVYSILTGGLAVVFFGSMILLEQFTGPLTSQDSPLAVVISTLVIRSSLHPYGAAFKTGLTAASTGKNMMPSEHWRLLPLLFVTN